MPALLTCMVFPSAAQQRDCGTMQYLSQQLQQNPNRAAQLQQIEQHTVNAINRSRSARMIGSIITIPVVVHVVYNSASENISDAQIYSQIEVLNEDFRRMNADADSTWPQSADTEIEFCLARKDPNGNAANGITRTATMIASFSSNDDVKFDSAGGKNAWPAADYLNIWICDISGTTLGYAQFPGAGPVSTDGVVIDYKYFGTNGTATAPFDLGRTTTHEVGHWLNLIHIWGDGPCGVDDLVADTPDAEDANRGCDSGHVSCGSVNMVQNYMDYSDDACMNLFTQGQRDRMRALFDAGGFRESILSSTGCNCAGDIQCDDASACTMDSCIAGSCANASLNCNDQNACTTDGCDTTTGCSNVMISCDDSIACTDDDCNNGCIYSDTCCPQQKIDIAAGWNMISGYIIPDDANMNDVFQDIASGIIIVKNNNGQAFIPSMNINTIGDWNFKAGYKVKASAAATLTLGCTPANSSAPISLSSGWNIIAYLRSAPMDIAAALSSLGSNLILVKNSSGQAYIPSLNVNTIGDMVPGQGYQIKMTAPATLTYPP